MFQRLIHRTAHRRNRSARHCLSQNPQAVAIDSPAIRCSSRNFSIWNTPLASKTEIPNQIQCSTQAIDE